MQEIFKRLKFSKERLLGQQPEINEEHYDEVYDDLELTQEEKTQIINRLIKIMETLSDNDLLTVSEYFNRYNIDYDTEGEEDESSG